MHLISFHVLYYKHTFSTGMHYCSETEKHGVQHIFVLVIFFAFFCLFLYTWYTCNYSFSALMLLLETHSRCGDYMSRVVRKPVFELSDQVRHKPGCTTTEYGWRLEISDLESRGIVVSVQRKQRRCSASRSPRS